MSTVIFRVWHLECLEARQSRNGRAGQCGHLQDLHPPAAVAQPPISPRALRRAVRPREIQRATVPSESPMISAITRCG